MFAGIIATLQGADDLSEQCRDMLVAMASPSLSTPKSDRHNIQNIGVTLIEEVLQDHKKNLIQAVEVAKKELADLEGSKNTLMQSLEDAKAAKEAKKEAHLSAQSSREEAKVAVKAANAALAEDKKAEKKADAKHAALEKERVAVDAAYLGHFVAPMSANEGPHYSNLKPFIASLGLEDSLANALPSSCTKGKEQRGSFDDLVLAELGKALAGKIAALEKSIAEEASRIGEHKAAVVAAEAVLETKILAEKGLASDLEDAAHAQKEAESLLRKASEDWATFEPRVQEATENLTLHEANRDGFEEGALKDFMNLRDKEAPAPVEEEEAAPAGA